MWDVLKARGTVFLVIFVGALVVTGCDLYPSLEILGEECERIARIAEDEEAVAHLDDWASRHILDKGYFEVSGMDGRIHARIHGISKARSAEITSLPDQSITGIESQYFRFSVETIGGRYYVPITSENVGQITFGQGRNSIIRLKNGQSLQSHRGHDESSGHLLRINDSLFAYCADARFEK